MLVHTSLINSVQNANSFKWFHYCIPLVGNVVIVEMSQCALRGFITVALRSTLTSFTDPMPLGLSLHTTLKMNPS